MSSGAGRARRRSKLDQTQLGFGSVISISGASTVPAQDLNDMAMEDADNFAGEGEGEELEGPQARYSEQACYL